MTASPLTHRSRVMVLLTAILAMVFDGVELGMIPIASLAVSRSLLGADWTPTSGGDWFARWTAALMLGAALGGVLVGMLGDRVGHGGDAVRTVDLCMRTGRPGRHDRPRRPVCPDLNAI